jgi:hypothetical protein
VAEQNGTFKIELTAGDGAGVTQSQANPEGADLYITRVVVEIETPSTGACTLDIGVAADATTSNDTLIDGLSAATAGIFCNGKDPGSNGKLGKKWGASEFFNVAEASGDITGLVGNIYVDYIRML